MSSRRRFSTPAVPTLGKVLTFDWDLFMTDTNARPLKKSELEYGNDYLILQGNFSGKIARYVGTSDIKQWGAFSSVRGNQIRVRCDTNNFACIPRIGCWMESISSNIPNYDRPPMLVIQSKSLCGIARQNEVNIVIREGNNLLANFRYCKDITPESIDLPKLENTIYKISSHKKANNSLKQLITKGFFACYEDDGWLIKCNSQSRIRFMRRSHLICITICRCGKDVTNTMFDDYTLRALLPSRYFGGLLGMKLLKKAAEQSKKPHMRRSSSFAGDLTFGIEDLIGEDPVDKAACYKRIFERCGSVDGNLLIKDTKFLDGVRSFVGHGGLARNCICPNIVEWRRMVRMCARGEDDFRLMEDVRIVNGQWVDVMNALPNNRARVHSFSCIYYDGTVELNTNKLGHKVLKEIHPKQDISLVFEKHLLMNGAYLVITLSRKGVDDVQLAYLFDNVREFVSNSANKFGYNIKRVAFGIYKNAMIYCDFQVWLKPKKVVKKRRIRVKHKLEMKASDESKESFHSTGSRHEKRLSNMGFDPSQYEFYNKRYENDGYYDENGNLLTKEEFEELEKKSNKLYEYFRPYSHGNKMSEDFVNNTKFQHFQGSLHSPVPNGNSNINNNIDNSFANNAIKYGYRNDPKSSNNQTEDSYEETETESESGTENASDSNGSIVIDASSKNNQNINRNGKARGSRVYNNNNDNRGNNNNNIANGNGMNYGNNGHQGNNNGNRYYEYYRQNSHGNRKSEDLVNNQKYGQFYNNRNRKEDTTSEEDLDSSGHGGHNGGNNIVNGRYRKEKRNVNRPNGAQGMLNRKSEIYDDDDDSTGDSEDQSKSKFRHEKSESRRILLEMLDSFA